MYGQAILFCYLGAVGSIFLLNAVQWSFSRNWTYGIYTLQTLILFSQSIFNRFFVDSIHLTESLNMAIHATSNGLVTILYIELIYRLFHYTQKNPQYERRYRYVELGLTLFVFVEVGMLITNEQWHMAPPGWFISTLYWSLLITIGVFGIWVSARRQDAVGRFFLIGSILMLVHKTNILFNYTGFPWTLSRSPESINMHVLTLGIVRIVELLCFSLCLVFRQRQIEVAQAVKQTRREEQLVQDRLKADLSVQRLEQEKTDVQLRALQSQVNPHFLFNSLNSLSSLIDDDPGRASQFVNELSLVYRYLLRANDQTLTTLSSELDFIQSYYHLLKTRHGNGLDLRISVDEDNQMKLLPPLTLQLLVENAVKHNITSAKQPLTIEVFTANDGQLVVRNNLQRKKTRILSNGVGLSTIATHYQKLQQPAPIVTDEDGQFTITLPLIVPTPDPVVVR